MLISAPLKAEISAFQVCFVSVSHFLNSLLQLGHANGGPAVATAITTKCGASLSVSPSATEKSVLVVIIFPLIKGALVHSSQPQHGG